MQWVDINFLCCYDTKYCEFINRSIVHSVSYHLIAQVLKPAERQRLVENIAGHAINASDFLQKRVVKNFSQADPEYGRAIQEKLDQLKAQRKAKVSLWSRSKSNIMVKKVFVTVHE